MLKRHGDREKGCNHPPNNYEEKARHFECKSKKNLYYADESKIARSISMFFHYLHKTLFILSILLLSNFNLSAQSMQSPEDFLGYPLGSKFTFHHQVVEYFTYIAQQSEWVTLQTYGKSYEGRPLIAAIISSPENIRDLEKIRQNHLTNINWQSGELPADFKDKPIIWLNYNIHGNESAATISALATLFALASVTQDDISKWLEEVIVILEPCVNPDGYARYVNWYNQKVGLNPSASRATWEHREPWPGGRYNHYLFDLNRDWAWQTQQESQFRLALYQKWMPHVHVDFHEMSYENSYFFAPAAKPFHEVITPWQKEFQTLVGNNHARYFNENNWLYFTKEVYDLFYPSYGDTWPLFNGAIGFTYEQGGSGRAGLVIERSSGDSLSLKDRYLHHYTTGLSTIEVAYQQKERLTEEFKNYFEYEQVASKMLYKSYVIKHNNPSSRIRAFLKLLDKQKIRYSLAKKTGNYTGFNYTENKNTPFKLEAEDWLINVYQPQARLVKVLLEPKSKLEDSLTYDLTAWALPYAYGLESYALKEKIMMQSEADELSIEGEFTSDSIPYACLIEWQDVEDVRFLGALLKKKIQVAYSELRFSIEGREYKPGTLLVRRTDNKEYAGDLLATLKELALSHQQTIYPVYSGIVDEGKDLGSEYIKVIKAPKVAIIGGERVSALSLGAVWHYFEHDIHYPLDILSLDNVNLNNLLKYDVLILASGGYSRIKNNLLSFASQGGTILALESSVNLFAKDKTTQLFKDASKLRQENERRLGTTSTKDDKWLKKYQDREREALKNNASGAIFKVYLDTSHPLSYGIGDFYFMLKQNNTLYPYLSDQGWNVGYFKNDSHISGFAGSKILDNLKRTLAIGVEERRRGQIIYISDSPAFRGFWHIGKLLLGNAIFF